MKFRHQRFSFWGFPYLLVTVFLFLSIYAVRSYINYRNNPVHLSAEFQKEIAATESELIKHVEFLISKYDPVKKDGSGPGDEFLNEKMDNGGFFLFIYKNDSLVWWNNNQVILPDDFSRNFVKTSFA